jgi:hypothetical protein
MTQRQSDSCDSGIVADTLGNPVFKQLQNRAPHPTVLRKHKLKPKVRRIKEPL